MTETINTAPAASRFKVGERSINEIIADLRKPIAAKHLKTKKISGRDITFIPWYHAVKYLDLYAPGWSYEIARIDHIKDKVVLVVRVTVPAAEGLISREATGNEDDVTSSYGDPFSNSESMAIRRAAAKFGLGLYLYEGGK